MANAPILLRPSGKDYLWGGSRLNDDFEKAIDMNPLAETWECSTHPDGPSFAVGGKFEGQSLAEILRAHPEYLGTRHTGETGLPILVKFIDARENLSVQVHPDDAYAKAHENGQLGKTEMWYVLDAARDSHLVYGLSRDTDAATLRQAIAGGTLEKYLQRVPIRRDDVFFIPAGTIHAICRGIVVAEVQQSSNVTYRVCDYGRLGPDGKPRALHIAQALDVTRRTAGVPTPDFGGHLARCDYFTVDLLAAPQAATCGAESFLSLLILDGEGEVRCGGETVRAKKGDSLFLPAGSGEARLTGTLRALVTRI